MSEVETLGILDEIQALVSDRLQVVSYKWLSRNFLVSSDTAKRLLLEFVTSHENGFQVVYSLSGFLKSNPSNYSVRLVPGPKLEEAKEDFNGCCAIQVYSVQACIPKDPATIRNAEFVQAEELYGQPATVGNCFRDNRFCGISNSFARRNAEGTSFFTAGHQLNGSRASGPSSKSNVAIDVKGEAGVSADLHLVSKPPVDKGKVAPAPADKKGGHNSKNTAGAGGSSGNPWSRASAKSKDPKPIGGLAGTVSHDSSADGEAQICASKVAQLCSDDEAEEVNFRRTSNSEAGRKRRVVFDFSDEDEYEDAVSLASPGLPKAHSILASKDQLKETKPNIDLDGAKEDSLKVRKGQFLADEMNQEENSASASGRELAVSTIEKVQSNEINSNGKTANAAPTSPKRKKMLKTRIDERGREVTEVTWEGEDMGNGKADSTTMKKADNETLTDNINRPPVAKKPPSAAPPGPSNAAGKAGNKKVGSKDPKQGNILSFFKRV